MICFLCILVGISIGTKRSSSLVTDFPIFPTLSSSSSPQPPQPPQPSDYLNQVAADSSTRNQRNRGGGQIASRTKPKNKTRTSTKQKEQLLTAVDDPHITIFYHVFIPSNDEDGKDWAYHIIQEQFDQIAKSSATSDQSKLTLYYITIGEDKLKTSHEKYITKLCNFHQLECKHHSHHSSGYEMITQQALLEYCQKEEHTHHIVSYIHDKGTLNRLEHQSNSRQLLTWTALSDQCMVRLLIQNQCNVCGANFMSVWGPTYWGNMWSARCDYVQNLISPFDLYERNVEAYNSKPNGMTSDFFYTSIHVMDYSLGKDRFAAEQFIGNHPHFIPCSFRKPVEAIKSIWAVNPPEEFRYYIIPSEEHKTVEDMEGEGGNKRIKEWYLLPGILWRYHTLYNEMPPPDSWIWRHYPDGDIWKETIEKDGFPQALYNQIEASVQSSKK